MIISFNNKGIIFNQYLQTIKRKKKKDSIINEKMNNSNVGD